MPTAGTLSLCTARGRDPTSFSVTTHNIQKAPALCGLVVQGTSSTGPASVMMERLRDFGITLELGDQILLCPCSVMLFSSGPLDREKTGLTSHMKPAYCPGEAGSWRLLEDECANRRNGVFSICLISKTLRAKTPIYKCHGWLRATYSQNGDLHRAIVKRMVQRGVPRGRECYWSMTCA